MVKVILKPIDNDHKPVELSEGKTILGRGPLLGCSDKKVSRNHAVLEINAEGEIFLTPTHVNPCFYRTKSDTSPKMMKKDKALRLEPGDIFSLLPLTFQYQILLPPEQKPKESVTPVTLEESKQEEAPTEKTDKTSKEDLPKKASLAEGEAEAEVTLPATPAVKKDAKDETGPSENGRPDQEEDDDVEMLEEDDGKGPEDENGEDNEEEEEDEEDKEPESPKPKRKANASASSPRVPVVGAGGKRRGAAATPASQEQAQPRRKRTLPNWLIKSASQQAKAEDNNGEALQKEDRGKRKGRKGQSEGSNTSRSARQNRQTIQRISLEDFVVSEEDWNSEDSAEGGGAKGGGGGRGAGPKRGRRRQQMDDSSGSDWEAEHKNQGRGGGRGAKDNSSGSDWETGATSRRSSRRGAGRRRAAQQAGSESGSDWETDRRKKTPVVKKTRGRRSRKKSEDEDDDIEDEGNMSDGGSSKAEKTAPAAAAEASSPAAPAAPTKAPADSAAEPAPAAAAPSKKEPPVNTGRKSCQFGRKCYRKNAAHLESMSHPGDSDYESPTEDSKEDKKQAAAAAKKDKEVKGDDDSVDQKPECPYGTECYRKNAQHRKDFLHTKKVRPKRAASKPAAKRGRRNKDDQDDLEDEEDVPYDLTDDDSNEYKPEESVEK